MARKRPEMVSVPESALRLGVSVATVWRRLRRGALTSVKRGGRRLIPADELHTWAADKDDEKIRPMSPDHPMMRLMGAYRSDGKGPGSEDKYAVLYGKK